MIEAKYPAWSKTERLEKVGMLITEKIDGTNALIAIGTENCISCQPEQMGCIELPNGELEVFATGKRTGWCTPGNDNFGFAAWVYSNIHELVKLGRGRHYGEWWGQGIQRQYGLDHKRFSLFNTAHPPETLPSCVHQVPVLYRGKLDLAQVSQCMDLLRANGSEAALGFDKPEGVIVWLGREKYKVTFDAAKHLQAA